MSASLNKRNYAVFNFANFSEAGLKAFADSLAKFDSKVASITATNKTQKKDGLKTKKAKFFFDNQQTAEVTIGEQGDISILKINSKVQPTGQPKHLSDLAKHISQLLTSGQAAFDKSLKRRLERIKTGSADKKPASRTNKARLAESETELQNAQRELSNINEKLSSLNQQVESTSQERLTLESQFSQVQELNKSLKAEFKQLTQ